MSEQSASQKSINLQRAFSKEWRELAIKLVLFTCALLTIATTVSIIYVLLEGGLDLFEYVTFSEFFFGTEWSALSEPHSYGILPLLSGTLMIMFGAALIALPLGLASAIFLSEFATDRQRKFIKPSLEVLAGIPTVVYGYFALKFITPVLAVVFPSIPVFNALSAMIVVGIMVMPMVASLCDDALRAVPGSMRQAGYAIGATQFEVTTNVVVPAALSGVLASFVLAMSRAIGETMAVTIAAGSTPKLTGNPLEGIQTMTAFIVQAAKGDAQHSGALFASIFAVAGVLFLITFVMNVISNRIMRRYKETYE